MSKLTKNPRLVGKIYAVCGSKSSFAEAMGMSRPTLSAKLNGNSLWKKAEIDKAIKILNIPKTDVYAYFLIE